MRPDEREHRTDLDDAARAGLVGLTVAAPYFLRREALEAGMSDKMLRALVRAGVVRRIRHGTYAVSEDYDRLTPEQRHVVLGRAATARLGEVAVSHVTAALAHGMEVWDVDLRLVHVTRLDNGAGRTEAGIRHHECFALDSDVVELDGLRLVSPARAALEVALLGGVERGLVTADSGLRKRLFTPDDLDRQARLMRHWPGALLLRLVCRMANPLTESVAETRCLYLFFRLGLPAPVPQYAVHDARGVLIGRVDFAWPEHRLIVEFDGAVKYDALLRPGETASQAVVREKRREDRLRAAGWTVIRLCWADLADPTGVAAVIRPHLVGLGSAS